MTTTPINLKSEQNSTIPVVPKDVDKFTQINNLKYQKVGFQQNPKNLKLIANQSQSKPAIVRRNSPSQKG